MIKLDLWIDKMTLLESKTEQKNYTNISTDRKKRTNKKIIDKKMANMFSRGVGLCVMTKNNIKVEATTHCLTSSYRQQA